jgi:DNA-binding XRE family transcriptional regulator
MTELRNASKSLDTYLARRRGEATRLAKELGITPQRVCDIRKGRMVPSLELALRIAKATGIPVESFVPTRAA